MTKLDCNVVNCSYNEDNCCRREDIHVEGMKAKMPSETSCGSFAARGCGCATNKMVMQMKAEGSKKSRKQLWKIATKAYDAENQ